MEEGRYSPIFPKTPACYGFSILAKVIPGREEQFYEYARNIEQAVAAQPDYLAALKLHYLRWRRHLFHVPVPAMMDEPLFDAARDARERAASVAPHALFALSRRVAL